MHTNKCVDILNNYFASVREKIAGQIQSDNELPAKINPAIENIENSYDLNKNNLDNINFKEEDILYRLLKH